MDRLNGGRLAGCCLGLVLATAGCRSAPSPVPPGRQFSNEGASAVGFGSEPHPAVVGPVPESSVPGTAHPSGSPYGPAPTSNAYDSAPLAVPNGIMSPTGPAGNDPAAMDAAGYGPAPGTAPAGTGAPAVQMDPAPGTVPAIPEDLPGIPSSESPR